ncbi:MAG: hypothetical protein AAFQ12_14990 [Pseudomonadota bacterium]
MGRAFTVERKLVIERSRYGQCRSRIEAVALGVFIDRDRTGGAAIDLNDADKCFTDVSAIELRDGFAALELWGKLVVAERMFRPNYLIVLGDSASIEIATVDAATREFKKSLKKGNTHYGK